MTRLACIIPFFDGADTIARALDSVLRSPLCDEVIIVNDGSGQALRPCLSSMHLASEREGRLRVLELATNVGQGAARNMGVAMTRATWVSFLDQDDELLSTFHIHALACLQQYPDAAAVEVGAEILQEGARLMEAVDPRYSLVLDSVPWNVVVRRSAFWVCGGFPSEPVFRTDAAGEDIAFKSALKACYGIRRLHVEGVRHHVRPGSATDRFIGRTALSSAGDILFKHRYPVEQDGTLVSALRRHISQAIANRDSLTMMRGVDG